MKHNGYQLVVEASIRSLLAGSGRKLKLAKNDLKQYLKVRSDLEYFKTKKNPDHNPFYKKAYQDAIYKYHNFMERMKYTYPENIRRRFNEIYSKLQHQKY